MRRGGIRRIKAGTSAAESTGTDLVLPERPAGTETLGEEALAALVTRDAMIGVAKVNLPHVGGRG